jgi:hypothetical protein
MSTALNTATPSTFRGIIAVRSKVPTAILWRGEFPSRHYTLFVFDDTLVIAALNSVGFAIAMATAEGLGTLIPHHGGKAVKIAENAITKKHRAKQADMIAGFPPDLTVEQLLEQVQRARSVAIGDVASVKLKSCLLPPGKFRGLDVNFKYSRRVARYARSRRRRTLSVTADMAPTIQLLTDVLGNKLIDKRRFWGKK